MLNLLINKLHRPVLPAKRVQRSRLLQRLNDGLAAGHGLTLISAPAGFGKTTCVSEWINALNIPVAWLSLDPADDDPGRFCAYLIAAVQTVHETLGAEIGGVLRSGQLPPAEIISTTLINDILTWAGRCLLVLDDFQVIQDRFVLQVLEQLIANLPRSLHLVLLTREDPPLPLARLRANNQLTEIRAGDLRFTEHEADHFLTEVLGLALSQADIAALEDRTEGWIVGLQLAGISVCDRTNPSSFIATLSGSHRHILNYLTEEVLSRQPSGIQQFLLQTSILDKLTGELCNAVTGRTDGQPLLDRLFGTNLFLIPLDDEQRWYRYHHLFAGLLRNRQHALQSGQTPELHRRASRWYAQAGLASEAIQHALAATDYPTAVQLIESHALELIRQGYVQTVHGWLQALPPEWHAHSPRTNLALTWMHALRGAYDQAVSYLEQVQASEKDPSIEAEWSALQALLLNMRGKAADSLRLTDRALGIALQEDHHARSLIHFAQASAYQLLDDYDHTVEAYQKAIRHSRATANFLAEMMSISGLALLAFEHGQLLAAFEIASPVSERVARSGALPPISAVVYGVLGQIHYQWHQLEPARTAILRAIRLSVLGGLNTGAIYYRALLARLLQRVGDLAAATQELRTAVDLMQAGAPAAIEEEVACQQVRIALAQQGLVTAEVVLQKYGFSFQSTFSFPEIETERGFTYSRGLLSNSGLRVLLHHAQARRDPASLELGIARADRLIAGALQRRYVVVALEALLLRGQMHDVLGHHQAGLNDYVQALEMAEPEGCISVFIEAGVPVVATLTNLLERGRLETAPAAHVKKILAIYSSSQPVDTTSDQLPTPPLSAQPGSTATLESPDLIVPLTDRERDVLRLMVEGLTYEEMAARLFISLNTVRSHVRGIYSKLGVNNRAKAIEQAHQLQII